MDIKSLEQQEYDKYTRLYNTGYGSTGYQDRMSEYLQLTNQPDDTVLDLGCGHGIVVRDLIENNRPATGVDITMAAIPDDEHRDRFIAAPLWNLPFSDGAFACTFSTDVLEHVPTGMVDSVIKEIYRVTRERTVHVISTRPSWYEEGLHLTVRPIQWWRDIFETNRPSNSMVECTIEDCEGFLTIHKYVLRRFMDDD